MIVEERSLKAKSVHTFCWPFCFTNEAFDLKSNKSWKKNELLDQAVDFNHEIYKDSHMLEKYLTQSAKNIFGESKTSICETYLYRDLIDYDYKITTSEKVYSLPIVSIELHQYNFGFGILFIQAINDNPEYNLNDIKIINDLGRRLDIPFIPDDLENGFILCAEKLEILSPDKEMLAELDFREILKSASEKKKEIKGLNIEFGAQILFGNSYKEKITKCNLKSFSDDRMYLISLIRDKHLSEVIAKHSYKSNKELNELIYSLIFVDPTSATCQDSQMREELLDASIYRRWLDYGTLFGVTNYAFICVTTEDSGVNSSVIRPFLVEYSYFASLLLAQSMGIFHFAEETNEVVKNIKKDSIIDKVEKDIIKLQESYILFKSQYMLLRISTQDQGIELYKHMQKQFFISEEQELLDKELSGLYDMIQVKNSIKIGEFANSLTKQGNRWAVAAFVVALLALIVSGVSCILPYIIKYTL